ncbi:MAG: PD-(D/E)XK nuclease family protein [Planctomycetes bacterium]|nr:PD-(D/E)XK nuclease family protein [Planctomycetota bacterium]
MLQTNATRQETGSFSRLSCWLNCPRKYQFEYIEEAPAECTPSSLLLGSAIHEAVEAFMDSLKAGTPMTSEEVSGVFHRAVTDSAAIAQEQGAPVEFSTGGVAELLAKGDAMLAEFLAKVDRRVQVIGTEVGFEFELEPGRRFRGYIDLILRQGDGRLLVVDLKTSATTYGQDRIEFDQQATLYIAAAEWLFDASGRVDFEFWLLTKTKSPSFKIIPVHRTGRDRVELIDSARNVEAAVTHGIFPRQRGYGCFSCQHRKRCEA